jgi:glycosyltransferase involved in cell wall biosynthesis
MRVLYVLDSLAMGGAERNTLHLMSALSASGHDVHLCCLRRKADAALQASVAVAPDKLHVLGVDRIYDPRGAIRLARIVRKGRFDCVHVEDPYANLYALFARYALGVPMVMTRHVDANLGEGRWARLRSRLLCAAARHTFDRVILVAAALRPRFDETYGIAGERIRVVHNGAPQHEPPAAAVADLRRRYGWPETAPVVAMVAVMREGKGHDVLLEAAALVRKRHPQALFVLAGDGPLRPAIERMASGALAQAVRFMGERSDVPEIMCAADMVVLPSLSEAFPTVLIEAAMAGRPAVATRVGGIAEIVEDGRTGLLVPPSNPIALAGALMRLIEHPDEAAAMGRAAAAKARAEFTIARQAERTLAVYREATGAEAVAIAANHAGTPAL